MDKFVVHGGCRLEGTVHISGSKNAALPILAATLLTPEKCTVRNVPSLSDIRTMGEVLDSLGMDFSFRSGVVETSLRDPGKVVAPWEVVKKMRASISVLGPLLAVRGRAEVSLPGGCAIGTRPVDLHLKGLAALGVRFKIEHGYILGECDRLKGADFYLGGHFGSSVLATANVMSAAVLAEGVTRISHASCEPEIVDLANFLNSMGARISNAGSSTMVIEGVNELHGTDYTVIPDRIETITFMMAAAATKGHVRIIGAVPSHLDAVIDVLCAAGVPVNRMHDGVEVLPFEHLKPVEITTLPYPGFPTDGQAQTMALLCVAEGTSFITERVFPDRFMHASELSRLGADIRRAGPTAVVCGVPELSGAQVMASDLRASAALVIAGLVAKGETEIYRVYHIDRGYERIELKLNALGANIERTEAETMY
ncbi:MAG: UDP-N-acetylglucosamine 1-carboxyvinyltransferase [Planctomycetota bacterium]